MSKRNVVSVSLSPEAKRHLDRTAEHLGMMQKELLGRLMDWFQAQDRMVQLIAVKQIPEGESDDIVLALYRKRYEEEWYVADRERMMDVARRAVEEFQKASKVRRRTATR